MKSPIALFLRVDFCGKMGIITVEVFPGETLLLWEINSFKKFISEKANTYGLFPGETLLLWEANTYGIVSIRKFAFYGLHL